MNYETTLDRVRELSEHKRTRDQIKKRVEIVHESTVHSAGSNEIVNDRPWNINNESTASALRTAVAKLKTAGAVRVLEQTHAKRLEDKRKLLGY